MINRVLTKSQKRIARQIIEKGLAERIRKRYPEAGSNDMTGSKNLLVLVGQYLDRSRERSEPGFNGDVVGLF